MLQKQGRGPDYLRNSINDYYQYNPDTLMPLLMLALATQGKLFIETDPDCGTVFASINIDEVTAYEWVKLNPALKKRLKELKSDGAGVISVVGDIPAELGGIYETFHHYDTVTVVQEYHHRKGILVNHSSNLASDKAQRQYATILFAEELLGAPQDRLKNSFLSIANDLLVHSGIQPERPRIRVAQALCTLLEYDGEGIVYNPFAGCALAAAKVGAGKNLVADGDKNDKLLAVARLLCYGMGQTGFDIEERDSLKWIQGKKADYVMSTFLGYPGGKSAFDICLSHCLEDFSGAGKFAGIAAPRDIFEKRSEEMKEALSRDWVDTIVLLPFGEVVVLVDAAKPAEKKDKIRFFNLTHPMLSRRPIASVLTDDGFADILKLSDVKKKGYLKSLVTPEIEEQEGCEIVTLGNIFEKMPRQTWSLDRVADDEKVLATIDRSEKYNEWEPAWMQGIEKESIVSLFSPAYKLDQDCLIVNSRGNLEPRLFDSDMGHVFFQDGFAFKRIDFCEALDLDWLIHELNKPYVERQLHPYGVDEMVPESVTEDQVLALKLNRPIQEDEDSEDDIYVDPEEEFKQERKKNSLPVGSHISYENVEYTIHRYLGAGYFGLAYTALARNLASGEEKEIVLKELCPYRTLYRDGLKAKLVDEPAFDINVERKKFFDEYSILNRLGKNRDNHIVPSIDFFDCPDTETLFYTMPFFKDGSLEDLQNSGFAFSEDILLKHVVIPMCKALHYAHKNRVLHLDIKPENILVDEFGDAALTDFGVAKQYDNDGVVINREGKHGRSPEFAAPEVRHVSDEGTMIRFAPQPDIYSLAATVYRLATGGAAHPVTFNSDQDEDLRYELRLNGYSTQFIDAIIAGLQDSAGSRPSSDQAFLNLFPECEDFKLK